MPEDSPAPYPRPSPARPFLSNLALVIALVIIGGLLVAWKPWQTQTKAADRTISVSGSAEISAEPDEYVFNPQYSFKNIDQKAALDEATAKTTEITAKLKTLGVADSKIKSNTNGYRSYYDDAQDTYFASLEVTVDNKALAQKVQDYLISTTPTGSVTPQADFSKAKRDQLTSQARDQATREARHKADQSAANLGFKIGKVKSVTDSPDNSFLPRIYASGAVAAAADGAKAESAPLQQGENKLTYQVSVVYYLD